MSLKVSYRRFNIILASLMFMFVVSACGGGNTTTVSGNDNASNGSGSSGGGTTPTPNPTPEPEPEPEEPPKEELPPPPSASYNVSASNATVGKQIRFSANQTTGITNYRWSFGDGSSGDNSPTTHHTYSRAGTFNSRLTVTDSHGQQTTQQLNITIEDLPAPSAAFSVSPSSDISVGERVSFSASQTSGITSYRWDFGDGNSGNGTTANHTYSQAGTFTARLTVTADDGQQSTAQRNITIEDTTPPPSAEYSVSPSSNITVGDQVSFSANQTNGITNYRWDFGDGSFGSGATANHTYNQAGSFTTRLTVTATDGQQSTEQRRITVEDTAPPPSAVYSATPSNGTVGTTVSFTASQTNDITNYRWDFGDGNYGSGATTTHTYDQAGTFTSSLTVTATDGQQSTEQRSIRITESNNGQGTLPGGHVLYDNFEYNVSRSGDSATAFNNAGWSGVKAVNITGRHAGYIYTVDSIPGYSGSFPGLNSNRVLAIESAAATFGSQSDFYLQFGDENSTTDHVPGNAWFQFWMYINHYDDPSNQNDQLSRFDSGFKFIYPTKCGYPSQCEKWIWSPGAYSAEPHWVGREPSLDLYARLGGSHTTKHYAMAEPYNAWKLGHNDLRETMAHNRWTLVKIHIDTSVSPGRYEMWLRPMGGTEVKVAEWIEGVTPGFTWPIPANRIGGHSAFRMPTTSNPNYNWWIYIDDFTLADSEAALPQYPY